jgi:hypothetical protein
MVKEGLEQGNRAFLARISAQKPACSLNVPIGNGWSKIAHAWRSQDLTDGAVPGNVGGAFNPGFLSRSVIGMAGQNRNGAIDLLREQRARQKMRPSLGAESQAAACFLAGQG